MSITLASEAARRKYAISLRANDMGESATNILMERLSANSNLLKPSGNRHERFDIKLTYRQGSVSLSTDIGAVDMSFSMADRLKALYFLNADCMLITPNNLEDFYRAAFLLLYRYGYVDPGFKRQGYLAPRYFEAISTIFQRPIDLEAFAAAFNTTSPTYCSLFLDVESPFGSLGSFFDLTSLGDKYLIQVSPPRIGPITEKAVAHCIKLLESLNEDAPPYYFILLTPAAWTDITDFILSSEFRVWNNTTKRGHMIEYHDVIKNAPSPYRMPFVSVLSNSTLCGDCKCGLSDDECKRAILLHEIFSV